MRQLLANALVFKRQAAVCFLSTLLTVSQVYGADKKDHELPKGAAASDSKSSTETFSSSELDTAIGATESLRAALEPISKEALSALSDALKDTLNLNPEVFNKLVDDIEPPLAESKSRDKELREGLKDAYEKNASTLGPEGKRTVASVVKDVLDGKDKDGEDKDENSGLAKKIKDAEEALKKAEEEKAEREKAAKKESEDPLSKLPLDLLGKNKNNGGDPGAGQGSGSGPGSGSGSPSPSSPSSDKSARSNSGDTNRKFNELAKNIPSPTETKPASSSSSDSKTKPARASTSDDSDSSSSDSSSSDTASQKPYGPEPAAPAEAGGAPDAGPRTSLPGISAGNGASNLDSSGPPAPSAPGFMGGGLGSVSSQSGNYGNANGGFNPSYSAQASVNKQGKGMYEYTRKVEWGAASGSDSSPVSGENFDDSDAGSPQGSVAAFVQGRQASPNASRLRESSKPKAFEVVNDKLQGLCQGGLLNCAGVQPNI
ncbi:hypothetical protein K2X33_05095 [bacterium]|nr:hypothetical protein [bacterium]